MNDAASPHLLAADEPPPFTVDNEHGSSPFLLICDHAGLRIPRRLGDLGVHEAERRRHIGWDIGAAALAAGIASALDAFLIRQTYSRLVVDCNRPPGSPGSIVVRSEDTDIPGNVGLAPGEADARVREIFEPYHARIRAELDRRRDAGRPTILVSVHSFTPVFRGVARPWHLGMLYGNDGRVARRLLEVIRGDARWQVGDNEPYAVTPTTDFAIPVHGERRGLPHVGLEFRQDLVEEAPGQQEWAGRMAGWLRAIAVDFGG